MNKIHLLERAIEIVKEYARGGGQINLDIVLKNVYEMLKQLNEDASKRND